MTIILETGVQNTTSIIVQTSKGNDIENSQDNFDDKSPFFKYQVKKFQQKFPGMKIISGPSEIYNCHGMTFANRRTSIFKPKEVHKIIKDDEYEHVDNIEETLPGDIVLYLSKDGDIEHSGIVIKETDEQLKIPIVISKWGSLFEVIHSVYICPYEISNLIFYRCGL